METIYQGGNADVRNSKPRSKNADEGSAEFKNFVADIEDVVKRVANVTDNDVARVRAKIQSALTSTKDGLFSSVESAKHQAQQAAKYADDYVRESPWQALGVGAAVAAVLGLSIGLLISRRE
jgi:ElaB/YqjD/DUF883 family membrane-anchored ribosome-binding protein